MDSNKQSSRWTVKQASITATLCFAVGVGIGYIAHGPGAPSPVAQAPMSATTMPAEATPQAVAPPIANPNPSPEELKAVSKKAVLPLEEQLKKNPKDFKLLVQAGEMYYHHGAFADASTYYKRALEVEDNIAVRNQYASALYFQGDADGALKQYSLVLAKSPKNEIALFNTGMVRFKAKKDPKGAIDSWETLLKDYPNHPKRDQVQHLIDEAAKQKV